MTIKPKVQFLIVRGINVQELNIKRGTKNVYFEKLKNPIKIS